MVKFPNLMLIRGLPGSGKSTRAREFITAGAMDIHLEADQFFMDEYGVYSFQPERLKEAHAWCQTMTEQALLEGHNVVVSNTFTQMWEIKPYADIAKRCRSGFGVIECNGQWDNVHGCSPEKVALMRDRWQPLNWEVLFHEAA